MLMVTFLSRDPSCSSTHTEIDVSTDSVTVNLVFAKPILTSEEIVMFMPIFYVILTNILSLGSSSMVTVISRAVMLTTSSSSDTGVIKILKVSLSSKTLSSRIGMKKHC